MSEFMTDSEAVEFVTSLDYSGILSELRDKGITGLKSRASACPLANLFKRLTGEFDWWVGETLFNRDVFVDNEPYWKTGPMREFTGAFDAGELNEFLLNAPLLSPDS
jgi:hypothetical protein